LLLSVESSPPPAMAPITMRPTNTAPMMPRIFPVFRFGGWGGEPPNQAAAGGRIRAASAAVVPRIRAASAPVVPRIRAAAGTAGSCAPLGAICVEGEPNRCVGCVKALQ
jgi:hypothetical protein